MGTLEKIYRGVALALLVCLILYSVPSGYQLIGPGIVAPASSTVQVLDKEHYLSHDNVFLTTVSEYDNIPYLFLIYPYIRDDYTLIPPDPNATSPSTASRTSLIAHNKADTENFERSLLLSQEYSLMAANRYLYPNISIPLLGLEVLELTPNSEAEGVLEPGDLITHLRGRKIEKESDLSSLFVGYSPDNPLMVTLLRDGQEVYENMHLTQESNGRYTLGVKHTAIFDLELLPTQVSFTNHLSEHISGASAGLAFCLEIIEQKTSSDLTHGKQVAITGTVLPDGKVVKVEGVRYKVIAAEEKGCTLFLCPKANEQEAKKQAKTITVRPVRNLEEALDILKQL